VNDATFSFSTKAPNGDIYTLRANDGESQERFLGRARLFKELVNPDKPKPEAKSQTKPAQAPQAQPGEKSIPVTSIKLAAGGDHPRWVVKGGKLVKFGVTCWPETLEAAGIAGKLDPLKDNKPSGSWIAYYSERTNDEGKTVPDKVLRLVKT